MERIRRRADFLAAAAGRKIASHAFILQSRHRDDTDKTGTGEARVGFTVSRKVGTAVERNRVRRRLKEIVRLGAGAAMRPSHDYVLIGRRTALHADFSAMAADLAKALEKLALEKLALEKLARAKLDRTAPQTEAASRAARPAKNS